MSEATPAPDPAPMVDEKQTQAQAQPAQEEEQKLQQTDCDKCQSTLVHYIGMAERVVCPICRNVIAVAPLEKAKFSPVMEMASSARDWLPAQVALFFTRLGLSAPAVHSLARNFVDGATLLRLTKQDLAEQFWITEPNDLHLFNEGVNLLKTQAYMQPKSIASELSFSYDGDPHSQEATGPRPPPVPLTNPYKGSAAEGLEPQLRFALAAQDRLHTLPLPAFYKYAQERSLGEVAFSFVGTMADMMRELQEIQEWEKRATTQAQRDTIAETAKALTDRQSAMVAEVAQDLKNNHIPRLKNDIRMAFERHPPHTKPPPTTTAQAGTEYREFVQGQTTYKDWVASHIQVKQSAPTYTGYPVSGRGTKRRRYSDDDSEGSEDDDYYGERKRGRGRGRGRPRGSTRGGGGTGRGRGRPRKNASASSSMPWLPPADFTMPGYNRPIAATVHAPVYHQQHPQQQQQYYAPAPAASAGYHYPAAAAAAPQHYAPAPQQHQQHGMAPGTVVWYPQQQ